MNHLGRATPARCLVVGAGTTAAGAALVALVAPVASGVVPAPGRTFDELLVGACAVAALVATGWLWLVTALVVAEAVRGAGTRPEVSAVPVPGAVRAAVLAACGVALCAPAAAVAAEPSHPSQALHGLPMPDRATSTAAWGAAALEAATDGGRQATGPASALRTHVVRTGDTLWSLAAADLSPSADAGDVTRRWHRLHELNRAVIGDDPDLIHPGQRLQLPPAAHRGDQP